MTNISSETVRGLENVELWKRRSNRQKKKKKKGGKVINAKHIEYIRVSNNVTPKLLLKISHTREPAV